MLCVVWALGELFTDRWLWSQCCSWLFSTYAAGGILACLGARVVLGRLGREGATVRPARDLANIALSAMLAITTLWLVVFDWRVWRIAVPPASAPSPQRVLVWNTGYDKISGFAERVGELDPDVVVITNANILTDWVRLRELMAKGGPTYSAQQGWFTIVSRHPIVAHGWTGLGISAATWRPWSSPPLSSSGGEAAFFEISLPGMARPAVIWCVDMPSDPLLHRRVSMREAASAVAGFRGPRFVRQADGRDVATQQDPTGTAHGFPAPDLIVGDFNTPRGAGSLGLFTRGLTHAYDQSAWGPSGSFPRALPLTHIDHAFVGSGLRTTAYEVVDLGAGRHRAQVVTVVGAGRR
jgi:hypothetical protein